VASTEPLSRLRRALHRASLDLDALGVRWALVGGLAVSARTQPRVPRDIDLAIGATDDTEAARVIR